MRQKIALLRILTKEILGCAPSMDRPSARRCASRVMQKVQIALQLRDHEIEGLIAGTLAARPSDGDPAVRRLVQAFRTFKPNRD